MFKEPRIFNSISHKNNMDVVRYLLCFGIIVYHSFGALGLDLSFMPISSLTIIGAFFALSGFLMFPSFEKNPKVSQYVVKRAWRILPCYVFIVLVCAFGMAAFSDLPVREYYSNYGLWEYIVANLSFLNFLHPDLPGVFNGVAINGSLWTMKGEWLSFFSVPLLVFYLYRHKRNVVLIFIILILSVMAVGYVFDCLYEIYDKRIYFIAAKQFNGLFVYFYIGGLINYVWKWIDKYKSRVLAGCILLFVVNYIYPTEFYNAVIFPFIFSLIVLIISLWGDWGHKIARHDNVSYEMYLFHLPIIYILIDKFNWVGYGSAWVLVIIVTIITYVISYIVNRGYLGLRHRCDRTKKMPAN